MVFLRRANLILLIVYSTHVFESFSVQIGPQSENTKPGEMPVGIDESV
jgi:hypothetical protein